MTRTTLSKSRVLSGSQCHLRLWYDCFARDLATPPDALDQARFDTGHAVGALACERYPGGVSIEADHRHPREALAATRAALADPDVPALYEAAFEHEGVLVRVDVLERAGDGRWNLVEVKSATRVKDPNLLDAAVQVRVVEGAGESIARAGILTLDSSYVYDGERLDLARLFRLHDVTEKCRAIEGDVGALVAELHAVIAAASAPGVAPGAHCSRPYACSYYAHCTRDVAWPEHPVGELPYLRASLRERLEALGVVAIEDIPAEVSLGSLQATVYECVRTGRPWIAEGFAAALAGVAHPVHHLDFETVAYAIPRFAGTRPYQALPFLFSVHTETADGDVRHREYLHETDTDPRRALAEALLDALGERGSICTYTHFEKLVIEGLARDLPDLHAPLAALVERLWDLHAVLKAGYYHPEFHGSYSIKRVLPALVPTMAYGDLAIADGMLAAVEYARSHATADDRERRRIHAELRRYCAHDSLAMVRLREVLREARARRPSLTPRSTAVSIAPDGRDAAASTMDRVGRRNGRREEDP